MANNSADQVFPRGSRSHSRGMSDVGSGRHHKGRMPSSAGYLIVAIVASIALFLALWWMLVSGGDEAPWLPAGLAASVVLLVALSAREVVMRRAWTRFLLENGINNRSSESHRSGQPQKKTYSSSLLSAALRAIQKQSQAADASGGPEAHLEVFHLCQDYLTSTDEALRTNLTSEKTIALRSGQERARAIQKHHMLTWARDTTRLLTREAQQKARVTDKIESANRALECLETALKSYPNEPELSESRLAIREYIASVKVAHWVELAERAAFKGHYKRAINRYMDALFYLNRESMKEEVRSAGAEKIEREIAALRTMIDSSKQHPEESTRNGGGHVER